MGIGIDIGIAIGICEFALCTPHMYRLGAGVILHQFCFDIFLSLGLLFYFVFGLLQNEHICDVDRRPISTALHRYYVVAGCRRRRRRYRKTHSM